MWTRYPPDLFSSREPACPFPQPVAINGIRPVDLDAQVNFSNQTQWQIESMTTVQTWEHASHCATGNKQLIWTITCAITHCLIHQSPHCRLHSLNSSLLCEPSWTCWISCVSCASSPSCAWTFSVEETFALTIWIVVSYEHWWPEAKQYCVWQCLHASVGCVGLKGVDKVSYCKYDTS